MKLLEPVLRPVLLPALMRARPASVGAGPPLPSASVAAYNPSDGASILNAGASPAGYYERVATIQDISGNGHHATQATDNKRPIYLKYTGERFLWCSGTNASGVNIPQIPYFAAMDIAADLVVEACIASNEWTAAAKTIAARHFDGGNAAWSFQVNNGNLRFTWYSSGGHTATSTTTFSIANYLKYWVRVEYVKNTGSGQYGVRFFTSPDGSAWTQLGSTITGTSTGDMGDGVSALSIGVQENGSNGAHAMRAYSLKLMSGTVAANTVVAHWAARDSTHFAATGPLRTGSTSASYGPVYNALIGRSCLYIADGAVEMDVASPFPMNYTPGGFAFGFRAYGIPSGSKLAPLGIDISQVPYPAMIYSATDCICADSLRNFTRTTAGFTRDQIIVSRIESDLGSFYQNGASATGIATSGYGYTQNINKLFRRGVDYATAGTLIDRFAAWTGNVTHPPTAEIADWLA